MPRWLLITHVQLCILVWILLQVNEIHLTISSTSFKVIILSHFECIVAPFGLFGGFLCHILWIKRVIIFVHDINIVQNSLIVLILIVAHS